MMVDCEQLISEVYGHRPLWDMSHPHHHHGGVLDKLWTDVSKQMGLSVKEVRTKWKSLRDHFRKELRKFPNGVSPSGYRPTWPYFQLLMFLKDQMVPKENKDNEDSSSSQQDDESQLHSISMKLETQDFDIFEEELSSDVNTSSRPLKRPFSGGNLMNSKNMRLEEPTSINPEEVDDDYHFFMSLLPTMKKFNDLQKMRIRSRFQQTILEELSQMDEYQNS